MLYLVTFFGIFYCIWYRGVRSRGAQCAYAPPESVPPLKFEIVCFCPSWKKLSWGADGADSMIPPVTSLLLIFSCTPKIHFYNPYLFLGKLNLSYQICVGFIFIYMKSLKCFFKYKITFCICVLLLWIHNIYNFDSDINGLANDY